LANFTKENPKAFWGRFKAFFWVQCITIRRRVRNALKRAKKYLKPIKGIRKEEKKERKKVKKGK